jgi:hypothetical protein
VIVRVEERGVARRDLNVLHADGAGLEHHSVSRLFRHVHHGIALLRNECTEQRRR